MRVIIFVFLCCFVYSSKCETYAELKTTYLTAGQAMVYCINPALTSGSLLFGCKYAQTDKPFQSRQEAFLGCTNPNIEQAGLFDCLQLVSN